MKDNLRGMPQASAKTIEGLGYPVAGMACRGCGCRQFRVISTTDGAGCVLRRRLCRHCGARVTTREEPLPASFSPPPEK